MLLDKSLRETEGGRHFGKVFCHERTRVLRRSLHLSVVLSSSTGSGSLFPTWWSECVNSGASQIHTTDCAQSVYYVKRAFDKVKTLHTRLLRKQALRTVCCVYLESPWVLWCSAGVYITPHKRLGLRNKKPGSDLTYAELFELLAVLCVSILVCVQAANFIRKTKLSVVTWGCHILSAMDTTLSTTGSHIHTFARSSRQAEVSNRRWSPGDMLLQKSTLSRTHIPWFYLCRQLTSQELRVFRKYSWPPRFKEPADILMLKSLLPGWKRVIPDETLLSRSHSEIWSAKGISRLGVWLASLPCGF